MYPTFKIKLLFIFFLLGVSAPFVYAGDKYQDQALEHLRKEIARAILQKDSSPIQTVLNRYNARDAVSFSSAKDDGDSLTISRVLPKKRPLKVSLDEWQALKRSSEITIEDTEDGSAEFTLLDLDEDGLRDLIISSYAGGTGMYSYAYAYYRSGGRFVGDKSAIPSDESSVTQLYSINGRGADQEADFVRINGRVYLAYRNGEYGKDELFLLRPFSVWPDKLKGIVVEYSYRHTLPRIQKNDLKIKGQSREKIDAGLYAALQKGLKRIQAQSKQGKEVDFGQCPVPANLTSEKQEEYAWPWFGPGHYTFDIAADFPVFEGNKCYAARLVSFKSSYMERSRYIPTVLWFLREPDGKQEEYKVNSARLPQRVRIGEIGNPFLEN